MAAFDIRCGAYLTDEHALFEVSYTTTIDGETLVYLDDCRHACGSLSHAPLPMTVPEITCGMRRVVPCRSPSTAPVP